VMIRHVWNIAALGKSVVVVVDRGLPAEHERQKRIDIWWRGQQNGSLMATLAHLLTQNWEWRYSRIRVLRVIRDAAGRESSREAVHKLIDAARIRATRRVIVSTEPFAEIFRSHSSKADVVFLGLHPVENESEAEFYRRHEDLLKDMPTTVLVHSSGEADLFA